MEGAFPAVLGVRLSEDGEEIVFRLLGDPSLVDQYDERIAEWEKEGKEEGKPEPKVGAFVTALKVDDDHPLQAGFAQIFIPIGHIPGWTFCITVQESLMESVLKGIW